MSTGKPAREGGGGGTAANHRREGGGGFRGRIHLPQTATLGSGASRRSRTCSRGAPPSPHLPCSAPAPDDPVTTPLPLHRGKQEGANLLAGGVRIGGEGYYIEPSVFADVKDSMSISREEIFGPVQCIMRYESLDEVGHGRGEAGSGRGGGRGRVLAGTARQMAASASVSPGDVRSSCNGACLPALLRL